MIKKDFLIRHVEEFGRVMGKLLTLRKEKEIEKFEEEIKLAVQRFTQLEISAVEELSSEDFYKTIISLDDDRLKMLGDLLFERMHYYIICGEEEQFLLLKYKSRKVYELFQLRTPLSYNMDVQYRLQYLETI